MFGGFIFDVGIVMFTFSTTMLLLLVGIVPFAEDDTLEIIRVTLLNLSTTIEPVCSEYLMHVMLHLNN